MLPSSGGNCRRGGGGVSEDELQTNVVPTLKIRDTLEALTESLANALVGGESLSQLLPGGDQGPLGSILALTGVELQPRAD